MLPWVIAHPGAQVDEVCERFGYTRRQLFEDLDLVFVCGLPGYGPGDLMVAYVEDDRVIVDTADYFAGAPRLSPSESVALLAAGMAVLGSGQGSDALASAVDKLSRALLPDEETLTVEMASAQSETADLLRTASAEGHVVEIIYTTLSRGDTTTREIEPWAVFTSLGNWYCSAFCRAAGSERVFRLDRIRDAKLTGERFVPPEERPAPEVRYSPSDDDIVCTIELGPGARWVPEYYPVEILDDDPSSYRIRFRASDAAVPAGLLLRLGPDARLIEGAEVRVALQDRKREVLARYRSGP